MAGALCLLQGNPAIFLSVLLGLPRPWGPRGSGPPAPCQVSAACSPHSVLGGWRNGRRDIPGVPQAGTLCDKGDQGSLGWRFQLSGLDSDVPAGLSVLGLWRQARGELHPRTGEEAVSSCREPRPCPPVSSALGTVAWLTAEVGGMKRTQRMAVACAALLDLQAHILPRSGCLPTRLCSATPGHPCSLPPGGWG